MSGLTVDWTTSPAIRSRTIRRIRTFLGRVAMRSGILRIVRIVRTTCSTDSPLLGRLRVGFHNASFEDVASLQRRKDKQARNALGSIFYGELLTGGPSADPVFHDPPYAPMIRLGTLRQLLAPGVIDPQKEDDLLMHLIHLSEIVADHNEAAAAYNQAWLDGAPADKLQQCYNRLQGCHWDYIEAHKWTMYMVGRIGPPPPLVKDEPVRLP